MTLQAGHRFFEFEFYPGRRLLKRGEEEIHLRQKSFDVLLFLFENRDRVVSKAELLAQCWPDTSVTDDVIFGCILDIRTALGDSSRNPRFVRTLSKAGYRFIAPVEALPETSKPSPSTRRRRPLVWGAAALMIVPAGLYLAAFGGGGRVDPRLEVGWWRLDEGSGEVAHDASGHGNAGRIAGRTEWVDGPRGKALRMATGAGHVEGEDSRRLLPRGNSPRTVAAWMRAESNPDDVSLFYYGPRGYPLTRRFSLMLEGAGKAALAVGPTYAASLRSGRRVADGRWHFIAGVYDGPASNQAHLYVDGELESSATLAAAPDTDGDPRWRAGGAYSADTRFRGDLQDVRMYARPLRTGEIQALYRCSIGAADIVTPDGRPAYFLPVFGDDRVKQPMVEIAPPDRPGQSSVVRQRWQDYSGIQFASSDGVCGVASLRGANAGQDLAIGADVFVPRGDGDAVTFAGPYLRNRLAAPGDGIIGGTSAGYWVTLDSNGVVRVWRLLLYEVVAHSKPLPRFDDRRFHRIEIAAKGLELEVSVDGSPVVLEQDGAPTTRVAIPPIWETYQNPGRNQGAAGIAFGSHPRDSAGGQVAREIVVRAAR